jgi:hypothetical protein
LIYVNVSHSSRAVLIWSVKINDSTLMAADCIGVAAPGGAVRR